MCKDCQECHDSSPHIPRALWVWRVRRWASQEVSETNTNAPTLPCLYLLQSMHASWVLPWIYFTANHHNVPCQNNKHLVTTDLSPDLLRCWSTPPPHSLHWFHRGVHLSAPSCSHMHTLTQFNNTYTQHSHRGWYTPTNVTFNGHSLSRKLMHTYNTLLHREPCCVLSGGTQMAATWCVLMGSCDGFGQDMDTHTDGDPLRVAGRWTCWLLICSDQWFTTWSSDIEGVAPTELAHRLGTLGTHHRVYAGYKSTKSDPNCHFCKYF